MGCDLLLLLLLSLIVQQSAHAHDCNLCLAAAQPISGPDLTLAQRLQRTTGAIQARDYLVTLHRVQPPSSRQLSFTW